MTGKPLTPAERQVMELMLQGLTNAQIAGARKTSEKTVEIQCSKVLHKLCYPSRHRMIAQVLLDRIAALEGRIAGEGGSQ